MRMPRACAASRIARPLPEEQELRELPEADRVDVANARALHRARGALHEPAVPAPPGLAAGVVLERHVERVVVEPFALFGCMDERVELRPQRVRRALFEALPRFAKQRELERLNAIELDVLIRESRHVGDVARRRAVPPAASAAGDEQRIAGEGREASVRRGAVAGRIQRQDLPDPHASARGPVEELDGVIAELADAVAPRQRRRMEKHAGHSSGIVGGGDGGVHSRSIVAIPVPSTVSRRGHRTAPAIRFAASPLAAMAGRTVLRRR